MFTNILYFSIASELNFLIFQFFAKLVNSNYLVFAILNNNKVYYLNNRTYKA